MRAICILVLWLTCGAIALTFYKYGLVQHYWYIDISNQGRGYDFTTWQGNNLANTHVTDGWRFRYSHSDWRFEKNAERRTIHIILVLGLASGGTIALMRLWPGRSRGAIVKN
jgi:hypothetical protein